MFQINHDISNSVPVRSLAAIRQRAAWERSKAAVWTLRLRSRLGSYIQWHASVMHLAQGVVPEHYIQRYISSFSRYWNMFLTFVRFLWHSVQASEMLRRFFVDETSSGGCTLRPFFAGRSLRRVPFFGIVGSDEAGQKPGNNF